MDGTSLSHTRFGNEIEMTFYSMPMIEEEAINHPGGFNAFRLEVGAQLPDMLIREANLRGAHLKKRTKTIEVRERTRMMRKRDKDGTWIDVREYQKYCTATFTMTLCIEEFNYHLRSHTPGCSQYVGIETGEPTNLV